MAQQRLGIIMNGVTGRMGMNQHLIRSIVAIRGAGRRRAEERRPGHARPDPGRPQRGQGRGARQGARHRALDHRSRRGTGRQERHGVLRRRHHAAARRAARQGDRRRQAHLLREAGRRHARGRARSGAHRQEGRHQARRGAGQAVPARPAQAQDADRLRLLRPPALGARRVRLLGVRGRLAAGAAAVMELPQGGGRRHHPRHGVPLALRARQPVRRRRERDVPRRDAHPEALSTRTARPTPPTSTTRPMRRSSSRAA